METTNFSLETAHTVAENLLKIKAIKIQPDNPFTWSSGWKSPIYCDNRLTLSYPEIRTFIKEELCQLVLKHFPEVEGIAGVATAGIPQAALIADALNLPLIYVRSKPKGHGMENMIEGDITVAKKWVVIEDLVSTGGSSLKAVKAIQEQEAEVVGMAAIFTYGFPEATRNFQSAGIPLRTLSDYEALLRIAEENKTIENSQVKSLQEWRKSPESWGN